MIRSPKRTNPAGRHFCDIWSIAASTACRLIISDACRGLIESAAEYLPEARWQRCIIHFYRNVFSHVPAAKVRDVAHMLNAIHAQESREPKLTSYAARGTPEAHFTSLGMHVRS